jgi:hypothetical protein
MLAEVSRTLLRSRDSGKWEDGRSSVLFCSVLFVESVQCGEAVDTTPVISKNARSAAKPQFCTLFVLSFFKELSLLSPRSFLPLVINFVPPKISLSLSFFSVFTSV